MAQNFSGENEQFENTIKFKEFFDRAKEQTKVMPNMNEITHGETFCNENYNGYDLSYLCVRYLRENLSLEGISKLMKNFDKIKEIGEVILEDAFKYYSNYFKNENMTI